MFDRLDTAARTAIGVIAIPAFLIVVSITAIVLSMLGSKPSTVHRFVYLAFARFALAVAGTRLIVRCERPLPPGAAWVIVSNHRGNWDPMCIMLALEEHVVRFVVKAELMRVPFFGFGLRHSGNLVVARRGERASGGSDVDTIRDGMAHRPTEVSMLFFAEGHRYDDPGVHPFKTGAFATALATGLPILPVAVAGSDEVFPKGRVLLRRGAVVVEIGEPIEIGESDLGQREALRDRTHARVVELHASAKRILAEQRSAASETAAAPR